MADTVAIWWQGMAVDHLYAECPAVRRISPPPGPMFSALDPEGGDVCGICLRWWRARTRVVAGGLMADPVLPPAAQAVLDHREHRGGRCYCGEYVVTDERRLIPPQWAEHVAARVLAAGAESGEPA